MSCKAIIKVGKNMGKYCNRYECTIVGHDKYVEGRHKCRSIIKVGRNKGKSCGRCDCYIHVNLVDFLELPELFKEPIINRHLVAKLISEFRNSFCKYTDEHKNRCISIIKCLLGNFMYYPIETRQILTIFAFKLLETRLYREFRISYPKLDRTTHVKITELMNDGEYYFREYFSRTFEPHKKYFSKAKNRIEKLKKYTLVVSYFLKVYKNIKENKKVEVPTYSCTIM
jgi:hypothetical protein